VPNWSVGKLKVTAPILYGTAIALVGEGAAPTYLPTEFFIVKCDANNLVLAAPAEEGQALYPWAACTFWCFKPKP